MTSRMRSRTVVALFSLFVLGMWGVNLLRMATSGTTAVDALKRLASEASTGSRRPVALSEVRFVDSRGTQLSLAALAGRPLLVNVWATWCPPCREELPDLDRLQQQLDGELQVVALSVDEGGVAAVERFLQQAKASSLPAYVAGPAGVQPLRIAALPTTLLIDRRGREAWRISGALPWSRDDVVALLRAAAERP